MTTRPSLHRGGFTLVELLVVIAIIGVLVSLMLPAINGAREAGRKMGCTNNARGLGQAMLGYENANKAFPNGGYSVSLRASDDPDFLLKSGFAGNANGYANYAFLLGGGGSGPRYRNFSLGNPKFSGPVAQVGGPGYSIAPYLELQSVYDKIAEPGTAYAQLDAFGCPSKGPVLETMPGYNGDAAGTITNGADPLTTGVTTGLPVSVAGAAGTQTKTQNAIGTVDSVVNQSGTGLAAGWKVVSQGMNPKFSFSAFAFNQQLCPDRESIGGSTAANQPTGTSGYLSKTDWAAWPNCIGGGMNQGNKTNVKYPRELRHLTDGASQTLMVGEINSDTRQYNSGNMVYRDHAFAGGGELTRALGDNFGTPSVPTLFIQLVFPDQNFDVMGWSNVRGYWGGPHPGGATMVMADGSVLSVPHGTDITSYVGIADQLINDSSKVGR